MTPVQIHTNNHACSMIILRTQVKMSRSFRRLAHLLFPDTLLSVDQGTTVSNNCVCVQCYAQLCPTLCDPMDCSLKGSSVHGVSQARIFELVIISLSRGSSQTRDQTHISCTGRQILDLWDASSVQSLSHVWLFTTPWTIARQASLSITNSLSPPKSMSIESVMPSNHLILCCPLLLLPPIPPSIRVFSNESALRIRWPKYWSFSFNISPSNEHLGPIFFRMDWLDLLAVQGTLKGLLQHHSSKASILWHTAFFTVQLSHPYLSHQESPYSNSEGIISISYLETSKCTTANISNASVKITQK